MEKCRTRGRRSDDSGERSCNQPDECMDKLKHTLELDLEEQYRVICMMMM